MTPAERLADAINNLVFVVAEIMKSAPSSTGDEKHAWAMTELEKAIQGFAKSVEAK